MKKFGKIAVLILLFAMLLVACDGKDEAPAPAELSPIEIVVDTAAFEEAVRALSIGQATTNELLDELIAELAKPEKPEKEKETGGGGDSAVVLDEDRVPLVTYYETTDEDGNPITLECGLAVITANPTYVLQKVKLPDGTFKVNKAGNPFMQRVPHMGHMTEHSICVESPAIPVDGGRVFRLQYAQQENVGDHDDWRGLGGDWNQCCFVDAKDVQREFYP